MPLKLPRVIGHRGAAAAAPENTLAGFREARRQGVDWVEFDAKLSADNRCFLLHDDDLDRTSNGKGPARLKTWDELNSLDAGAWKGPQFAGEKLPLLAETLELFQELDLSFNLELKPCPGREIETAQVVLDEVKRLWPQARPRPLISSFEIPCLEVSRDRHSDLPRGLLLETHPADWAELARRLAVETVNIWDRDADAEWCRAIKAAGFGLLVYTVNDAARAKTLIEWGVDGVFTDVPGELLGLHLGIGRLKTI
jgi:glycerophosphoryl diester phosphodiesterase